jgi:hypothetical protein
VLIAGIVIFGLVNKNNQQQKQEEAVNPNVFSRENVSTIDNEVGEIDWKVSWDEIQIPSNSLIIRSEGYKEQADKVIGAFEFGEIEVMVNNESVIFVRDKKTGDSIHANSSDKIVSYSKNIVPEKYFGQSSGMKTIKNLEEELKELVKKINETANLEFKVTSESYERNEGQRVVPATANDAQVKVIEGTWFYNGIPLTTNYGYPLVTAKYSFSGDLLELKMQSPVFLIESETEVNQKSIEQIQNTPTSEVMLFRIKGSRDFVQSDQSEALTEVVVTKVEPSYIFDAKKNAFLPLLIAEGTSKLESGSAKVILGISVTRLSYE